MTISVVVPGIPPSPNQTRREHWARRAAEAKRWKRDTYLAAVSARNALLTRYPGVILPLTEARVRCVIVTKSAVRRDPDNAIASMKPLIDGVVQAGILADDSFSVITDLSVAVERGPDQLVRIEVSW
jgi:Holliday junction resolvase RusA-like endonuclease